MVDSIYGKSLSPVESPADAAQKIPGHIAHSKYGTKSPPKFYLFLRRKGKMSIKPTGGNDLLVSQSKKQVRELIMQWEGINTPLTRCTQRGPSSQCCERVLAGCCSFSSHYQKGERKKKKFNFFIIVLAKILKPCAYISPSLMRKSEPRSSGLQTTYLFD